MRMKVITGMTLTLFLASVLCTLFNAVSVTADPDIIRVPDDYERIKWAVSNASAGDTILVAAGTYYEHVTIDKSLTLVGEDPDTTIVDGSGTGTVVNITANSVNASGFTIQKSGPNYPDSAILVDSSSGNNISGNIITNNWIGIWLRYSSNNTLTGNNISNNEHGIYLHRSSNNTLTCNTVSSNNRVGIRLSGDNNTLIGNNASKNQDGIRLSGDNNTLVANAAFSNNYYGISLAGSDNTLTGNNASNNQFNFRVRGYFNNVDTSNMVDGKPIYYLIGVSDTVYDARTNAGTIYLINCNNITIRDLTLTKNADGVFLWNTTNSKIENVTASNNGVGISLYCSSNKLSGNNITNNQYGVFLGELTDNNTLSGNNITNNQYGVLFGESTEKHTLSGNNITNNRYGLWLWASFNNKIYHNNFIDNTEQVYSYEAINTWDDGYPSGGNFWSDYPGQDLNGDGIGDTPYVIDEYNKDNYPLMNPYKDVIPPITTDDYDGLWHTTDFTITLTAIDDLSGVAETYYKINYGPTKNVSIDGQPIITTESANNTLEYWSIDIAGNEEIPHHILTDIKLDKTSPVTAISILGTQGMNEWYLSDATVILTATDSVSGVAKTEYSFDNVTWTTYAVSFNITEEGTATIYYRSTDVAGNIESTLFQMVRIDKTAPSGSIIIDDDNAYTASTSVTLSLSASDATSGISQMRFSNDGNTWTPWEAYTPSRAWELILDEGTKTVYVQFKDGAGLVSSIFSDTIILDTTPPTGSISINSEATYTTSTIVTLTLTYGDATSGVSQVRYSNDGVWDTETWESPSTTKAWVLSEGDGTKTVYYQIRDNTGLLSDTYSDAIVLDTGLPTTSITSPTNGTEIKSSTVTATWSGADETSGIDYYEIRLNNSSWINTETNTTHTFTGVDDGSHTVDVKAFDKVGHSQVASVNFTVNTSLIGGPGYTEEYAIVGVVVVVAVATAIYLLKIRKKT